MKNFLKSQYNSLRTYLKSTKQWCFLALMLIIEIFIFACLNAEPNDSYEQYLSATEGLYRGLLPFIFWENLKAALLLILFGAIPFGFGVIFALYSISTSLVSTGKWLLPQVGFRKMLLCTLPHGVFEISAICFSVVLSVLLCKSVTIAIIHLFRRKPVIPSLQENGVMLLKSILLVLLPLILFSAVMEATLSRWVAGIIL